MTAHRTELARVGTRPALVTIWAHPSGRVDVEAHYLDNGARERLVEHPCGARVEPPAPPALGVAITVSAATTLIGTGTVLAFGDGHGWWAAGLIAGGLLLLGRVLDVRGRR